MMKVCAVILLALAVANAAYINKVEKKDNKNLNGDGGCDAGYLKCKTANKDGTQCYPESEKCSVEAACDDSTHQLPDADGNECECKEGTGFRCNDGRCISGLGYCDGDDNKQCLDGSDEGDHCKVDAASFECPDSKYYRCPNENKCVISTFVCDKFVDCADGSDDTGDHCPSRKELMDQYKRETEIAEARRSTKRNYNDLLRELVDALSKQ